MEEESYNFLDIEHWKSLNMTCYLVYTEVYTVECADLLEKFK